jgi:hypothetical protein
LELEYNIDANLVGYVLILPLITYMIACPIISKFSAYFNPRVYIVIGFMIFTVGLTLSGPC